MKNGLGIKILGFITLFFVALFILFPINNLKGYIFDKVYRESGVLLVSDSIYFSLFGMPGIGMKNVSINFSRSKTIDKFSFTYS